MSLRAFVLGLALAVTGGALPASADVPARPIDLGMEGWGPNAADGIPCVTGPGRPVVPTQTPRLRARVFSGTTTGVVSSGFRVYTGTSDDHTWNGEDLLVDFTPSGSYAEATVPDGRLVEGGVYTWQAWQGSATEAGGFSELCEFVVDTTPPATPSVSSADYPAVGFNGSVGRTGAFTFTSDDDDVVKYGWSLDGNGGFGNFVTSTGETTTALITPKWSGPNRLYVAAFDRAGNRSQDQAVYEFDVAEPAAPTSTWDFTETGGTTAADTGGGNRPLTLEGDATFGTGHAGNALIVDGGFATTGSAVVDPARAFSIAVWVKVASLGTSRTVVSQDGAFALRYDATANRWAATAQGSEPVSAFSADPPEPGAWTFLAATYEPNSRRLSLYVNGTLQGTAAVDVPSASPGPLVVGAAQAAGIRTEHFAGSIDQVSVWDRMISATEIADHGGASKLLTRYAFDDDFGSVTGDSVGGQVATLSGGVTRASDSRSKWVHFDSTGTGRISAPKPAKLRTDKSYSVSAWVRADAFGRVSRTAVAADSAEQSSFALGYVPRINKWSFTLTYGSTWTAYSESAPRIAEWTHLVGVYDASTGIAALYVNGARQALESGAAPGIPSTDDLAIGYGKKNGAPADFWNGDVDDVTVHSGALTSAEASRLYNDTRHS